MIPNSEFFFSFLSPLLLHGVPRRPLLSQEARHFIRVPFLSFFYLRQVLLRTWTAALQQLETSLHEPLLYAVLDHSLLLASQGLRFSFSRTPFSLELAAGTLVQLHGVLTSLELMRRKPDEPMQTNIDVDTALVRGHDSSAEGPLLQGGQGGIVKEEQFFETEQRDFFSLSNDVMLIRMTFYRGGASSSSLSAAFHGCCGVTERPLEEVTRCADPAGKHNLSPRLVLGRSLLEHFFLKDGEAKAAGKSKSGK
mmetsp:Transcript_3944/g.11445  ORF Transcript_3944/g.11445 Transcript_3944/m.11445 type:complete len:252 (-) Transcript_3944:14-769(-)